MRRHKADQPQRQGVYASIVGYCRDEIIRDSKQSGRDAARYCAEVFTTGSSYDAMLLVFDDATSKKEALLNTVIRARISGRKVFVGLDYANIGEPQQRPV